MKNVHIKEPQQQAQACVIWMHGLGADAQDMMGLAQQLPSSPAIRHVFIDAPIRPVTLNNRMPMRAWYDIVGVKLTDREDREGIVQSEALIQQVIDRQLADGFAWEQLFLAGFSQGGSMALFSGLRIQASLGGIIALSSYLPIASECKPVLSKSTPIFIAGGTFDPIVLPTWTKHSADWLHTHEFQCVSIHEYPMEHAICAQEIRDVAQWLTTQIASSAHCVGGVS